MQRRDSEFEHVDSSQGLTNLRSRRALGRSAYGIYGLVCAVHCFCTSIVSATTFNLNRTRLSSALFKMPLHITVVPASTQAGAETIRTLLKHESKPFVRGIYRNLSKAPVELKENPNFQAVQGDVTSGDGLDLNGSQAVFYIPPPTYDGTESGKFATQAATNVKKAIERAPSVKKLLLFSSIGSQYDHGIVGLRHPLQPYLSKPNLQLSRAFSASTTYPTRFSKRSSQMC